MATAKQDGASMIVPLQPALKLPRLRWVQLLAISIFWFALNFHWAALGIIILPSQVFKLVGQLHEGSALAFVLIPGAFVALVANPLVGMLSDHTRGRFAVWGRRLPYVLIGTIVNIGALAWMATAHDLNSLALAYILVQFASNIAQAPFHALLPDIVPSEQRGLASGIMGLLLVLGGVAGVVCAGQFVDSTRSQANYQQGLWIIYGIIMLVMLVFMLITFFSVRDRSIIAAQLVIEEGFQSKKNSADRRIIPWLSNSVLFTLAVTGIALVLVWAAMTLWNEAHIAGLQISTNGQQVVLEVIAAIALLRLFGFNPRRNPDFAWVLVTRLVMMMGIFTIQTFLQYYIRDVVGAAHPEQETTNFSIVVSATSLISAFAIGWLSDRFGRKRMVYISGGFIALVGLVFIVTHSLIIVLAAGAIFGLGYGAYQSVDWALVADVLPSKEHYARDMGVWSIALAIPQIIAPVLGGPLIDTFSRNGQMVLGYQVLFAMAIVYCIIGTVTVHYIRGVKR